MWTCAYDLHMKNVHTRVTEVWKDMVSVSPFVSLSLTFSLCIKLEVGMEFKAFLKWKYY